MQPIKRRKNASLTKRNRQNNVPRPPRKLPVLSSSVNARRRSVSRRRSAKPEPLRTKLVQI
jgi:hypothetical protein